MKIARYIKGTLFGHLWCCFRVEWYRTFCNFRKRTQHAADQVYFMSPNPKNRRNWPGARGKVSIFKNNFCETPNEQIWFLNWSKETYLFVFFLIFSWFSVSNQPKEDIPPRTGSKMFVKQNCLAYFRVTGKLAPRWKATLN